jgi:hypothetical protein
VYSQCDSRISPSAALSPHEAKSVNLFHFRRGFIPKYCIDKGPENIVIALTLSPKLFLKLAIENGYPLQPQKHSTDAHVSRIYAAALSILPRVAGLRHSTSFLMQDVQKLTAIATSASSPLYKQLPLEAINDYFGAEVALYFGWLGFYSSCLYVPAVAGVLLFMLQLYSGEVLKWVVTQFPVLVLQSPSILLNSTCRLSYSQLF